jgi:cysteine desulfurase/selenocysteine lyase
MTSLLDVGPDLGGVSLPGAGLTAAGHAGALFGDSELARVRADVPILARTVRDGRRLVYLDSGATSQKPRSVLDAERGFYEQHNAAVHRGAHQLAEEATDAFEAARTAVAALSACQRTRWCSPRTPPRASTWSRYAMSNAATGGPGLAGSSSVLVTRWSSPRWSTTPTSVPWQELCRRTGATLRWLSVDDEGRLALDDLASVVTERTKVLAFTHVSNVLGTGQSRWRRSVARARAVGGARRSGRLPVGAAPAGRPACARR